VPVIIETNVFGRVDASPAEQAILPIIPV